MFNKDKFLEHIVMSLRALGVDMTPVGAPKNIIVEQDHVPNYHAVIYGHTPDYKGQKQPAYKVDIWIYPDKQKMFVQDGSTGHELDDVIFSATHGRYPAIHCLKTQGFMGMSCEHWEVEII